MVLQAAEVVQYRDEGAEGDEKHIGGSGPVAAAGGLTRVDVERTAGRMGVGWSGLANAAEVAVCRRRPVVEAQPAPRWSGISTLYDPRTVQHM